ncbi:ATP-binding protein [Pelovirga terrestris]|uniref:ATP-binding protein n=1 Tax=Pelovirga terrestris TaxID=2771352 RepID=UPI0030809872
MQKLLFLKPTRCWAFFLLILLLWPGLVQSANTGVCSADLFQHRGVVMLLIDPEQMERIFGIFSQLDARSEGIGLGLALVKKVVESYQGRIWVESGGPGQGSCFRFTLPGAARCDPSATGKERLLFAA